MTQDTIPPTAIGTVLIEHETTRITEWAFAKKGDNTGWHTHEYDYAVVPLFDGVLEVNTGNESVMATLTNGGTYFRKRGVTHDVINGNDFACRFIEIEFLVTAD